MKLIIGNKNYSSWSLRGWLAVKQSGLHCDEVLVPMYTEAWDEAKRSLPEFQPSQGRVPVLWDGDTVVWDSLAILEYLADKVGRDRFWPKGDDARALARSMVAEMHSGFVALRTQCTMNIRRRAQGHVIDDAARADVVRIVSLWAEARSRFGAGGPFLFGTFCAADIAFAPVVSRFLTYDITVPAFAANYMEALWEHPWMQEWIAASQAEEWVIAHYEV